VIEGYGGASRDRTDDLIVANDGIFQIKSFPCSRLDAEHGPLRSNSTNKFQACREKLPLSFSGLASPPRRTSVAGEVLMRAEMMLQRARSDRVCFNSGELKKQRLNAEDGDRVNNKSLREQEKAAQTIRRLVKAVLPESCSSQQYYHL
jgi:hypothetical protein